MHQCRHHALGVQLQVFRIVLLGREQVDQVLIIAEVLLGQRDEHLLGADRIVEGVEGEHVRLSQKSDPCCRSRAGGDLRAAGLILADSRPRGNDGQGGVFF